MKITVKEPEINNIAMWNNVPIGGHFIFRCEEPQCVYVKVDYSNYVGFITGTPSLYTNNKRVPIPVKVLNIEVERV